MTADTGFILITRFSLRIDEFLNLARIGSEQGRDKWFGQRSRLFKTITYPSICAQQSRPDKWYLLMSEGDQRLFEQHVAVTEDWIVPLYFKGGDDRALNDLLYGAILDDFRETARILISRIDNDDALERSFIARLKQFALRLTEPEDRYVLFRKGLRWDGEAGEELIYENGPFLTMFSTDWTATQPNPLLIKHTEVLNHPHVFVEMNEPMWMQSIHGENLYNAFKNEAARHPVALFDICARYGIDPDAIEALRENRECGRTAQPDSTSGLSRNAMFFPNFQEKKKAPAMTDRGGAQPARKTQPEACVPGDDAALVAQLKRQLQHANELLAQEKLAHAATREDTQFYKDLLQEYRADLKRAQALQWPHAGTPT